VQFVEAMYSASRGELFAMLQGLDDSVESVMILAHNPAIYELVATIASDGADQHMNRLAQGYEPASLSVVEAGCENWATLDLDGNVLKDLVSPIDYNAPSSPQRWT
jgi:phosphohistidine phosphatase SixA